MTKLCDTCHVEMAERSDKPQIMPASCEMAVIVTCPVCGTSCLDERRPMRLAEIWRYRRMVWYWQSRRLVKRLRARRC